MFKSTKKIILPGIFKVCALSLASITAVHAVESTREFEIVAQSLQKALLEYSQQTETVVVAPAILVRGLQAPSISGNMSETEALVRLLAGSGLSYSRSDDGSVQIVERISEQEEKGRGTRREKDNASIEIEKITVTATKRETSLQDTAMSISALGSDTIEKRGLVQMGDYLSTLPGVTMQERGAGQNSIVIRGIGVDPARETEAVGTYFGETPVSGIGAFDSGHADFRMVDIERVEVLRGPQGALYGSGSMGGTVRIIPAEPDLTQAMGTIKAGYSRTGNLGGDNTTLEGVFNLPLIEDKLAVRGVAYRVDNSGYIENIAGSAQGSAVAAKANAYGGIAGDIDDIGSNESIGFRLSALWQATDNLEITLSYARQDTEQKGLPEVNLDLSGTYQQIALSPGSTGFQTLEGDSVGPEGLRAEPRLASILVDYDLGWGNIHSSSSWVNYEGASNTDYTSLGFTPGPYRGMTRAHVDTFVEELRFTSKFDGPLQILAGIYYEDRDSRADTAEGFSGSTESAADYATDLQAAFGFTQAIPADAPPGFAWEEIWYQTAQLEPVKQKSLFGEVSYDITDRISATIGVRDYEYDQTQQATGNGFWLATLSPTLISDTDHDFSGQTYKANVSWTPNEDTLIYAQWSEGFRLGEPIPHVAACDDNGFYDLVNGARVPVRTGSDPDTLENIELGCKTSFADNRATFNASLYHIDWQGLPVWILLECGIGRTLVNAGEATSQGIELESRLNLTDNLRLDLSASRNETTLAKDSEGIGQKGADLPGSADYNMSAGLEYGFDLSDYPAFTRVDYSYVGSYDTFVAQPASIPSSGGYHQVHVKAGVSIRNVDVDLFVNNLTNADDLTWTHHFTLARGYRLRPRTIGLNLSYQF